MLKLQFLEAYYVAGKVYFSSKIDESTLVKLYDYFNKPLKGNVAVKVHSGEKGNKNFLGPSFFKNIVEHVNGTIVECNTAYDGAKDDSKKHWALMNEHEWTKYFKVDILDEKGHLIIDTSEMDGVGSSDYELINIG